MSIANQVKSLTEDIEASYGARVVAVSDIVKETHQTLGSFHRAHQKMAGDLGRFLASGESVRKDSEKERIQEFTTLIGEIRRTVEAISEDTAKTLSNFRSNHQEMAASLGRELSSFQKNLSKTVGEMRTDFGSDHRQARTHWQNLAKVMAAKRAGKPVPTPRAEMSVPKAVKEEAEEAFEKGEMKERVLAVIQAHPGGITLPEIGKALKVAYIRASKPLKELLMEMRVTKRDSEYFPA